MPPTYETTIYCNRSEQKLKEIMKEAVEQYLSSNPRVYPVDRQDLSIALKTPSGNLAGGVMTVTVQDESFYIISKSVDSPRAKIGWGKNRNAVRDMCIYLENAISHHNKQ